MITKLQHGPAAAIAKINEIIDVVNGLDRMTGDGFITIKSGRHGKSIGLALDVLRSRIAKQGGGFGGVERIAYCSEDAGADNIIAAELDEVDGEAIEVTCLIAQGGTALNAASPRLIDEDPIFVVLVGETWYCTSIFMPTDDCVCVEDEA